MSEDTSASKEIGLRELRADLGSVVLEVGVRRDITYVMNRGRRIAAIVPLDIAERAEALLRNDPQQRAG
ncbi:hypothetical protein [Streptomyces cyaneofuscatus]|uniref:hypothetical protein n=1 Tax=Streptomyces cyaneofuscatus TaxID=66883 RepID=UPI0036D81594